MAIEFGTQIKAVQGDDPGEAVMLDENGQVPGGTEYPYQSSDYSKLLQIVKSQEDIDVEVFFRKSGTGDDNTVGIYRFNAKHSVKPTDSDEIVTFGEGSYAKGPGYGAWTGYGYALRGSFTNDDILYVMSEPNGPNGNMSYLKIAIDMEIEIKYSKEPTQGA